MNMAVLGALYVDGFGLGSAFSIGSALEEMTNLIRFLCHGNFKVFINNF